MTKSAVASKWHYQNWFRELGTVHLTSDEGETANEAEERVGESFEERQIRVEKKSPNAAEVKEKEKRVGHYIYSEKKNQSKAGAW